MGEPRRWAPRAVLEDSGSLSGCLQSQGLAWVPSSWNLRPVRADAQGLLGGNEAKRGSTRSAERTTGLPLKARVLGRQNASALPD